jgi:hypothetical protein
MKASVKAIDLAPGMRICKGIYTQRVTSVRPTSAGRVEIATDMRTFEVGEEKIFKIIT